MRPWAQLLAPLRHARGEIEREVARVPEGEPRLAVLGERALRFVRLRAEDVRGLAFHRAEATALRAELAGLLPWPDAEHERVLLDGFLGSAPAEPVVSVVIPVYGKLELTLRCLLAVRATKERTPFEILVVDDGSPDRTEEVLSRVPGLRYLRNATNGGFIESCNRGAAEARGRYLCFLNNDTVVLPGWLDALRETLETVEGAGLVGSRLIYPTLRLQESGGLVWRDASAANWGNGCDPFNPRYGFLREADYVSAASALIARALFEQLGGFDRRYRPAYYEDTDLAFAVRAAGRRVLVQPASRVIHYEGATSGTDLSAGPKRHQVENQEKFRAKWAEVLATHGPSGDFRPTEIDRHATRRVLVIDDQVPHPDQDSGSVDLFNLLRILTGLRARVSFFAANPWLAAAGLPDVVGHDGRYADALARIGVEVPHHPYERSVARWLAEHGRELDVVMLARVFVADRYIAAVRRHCPRAKIVFHSLDLTHVRERREAELSGSLFWRVKSLDTARRELGAVRRADLTTVISQVEADLLAKLTPEARVRIVPLVREIPDRAPARPEGRAGVLFVGGFRHRPNADAALFLARDVWPHVRRLVPGAMLHVVGSEPSEAVRALAASDVVVHGHVRDLDAMLASMRATVAPLRFGAGLKGKVADSLAHGVPCVTTPIGVEGTTLRDGVEVLVGEAPEAIAEALARVCEDDALWLRLSAAGLAYVRDAYSLEANRARIASILDEL